MRNMLNIYYRLPTASKIKIRPKVPLPKTSIGHIASDFQNCSLRNKLPQ